MNVSGIKSYSPNFSGTVKIGYNNVSTKRTVDAIKSVKDEDERQGTIYFIAGARKVLSEVTPKNSNVALSIKQSKDDIHKFDVQVNDMSSQETVYKDSFYDNKSYFNGLAPSFCHGFSSLFPNIKAVVSNYDFPKTYIPESETDKKILEELLG